MKWLFNQKAARAINGPLLKDFHTNQGWKEAKAMHEKDAKGRHVGLPKVLRGHGETLETLQKKGMVGVYQLEKADVTLNGAETELIIRANPIKALSLMRDRTGAILPFHEYKEIVDVVGARLGVSRLVPCKFCDGRGSVLEWKKRQNDV